MPKTNFAFFCRESTEKNGIIRIKKTRKVDKKVKASRKKAFFIGTEQALLSNNEETVQIIKTVNTTLNIKGVENYFDITSVKPNIKEFVALKLKLLRWTALRLSQDNNVAVFTRLAIAYNPYYPEPYERWTLKGLYDLARGEILVGEEFWNFVAGDDIYKDLLDVFQEAGKKLRPEIDKRFVKFRKV